MFDWVNILNLCLGFLTTVFSVVEDFDITVWKVSKYGVISGKYFPALGLNTEIYFVNLRIQSEYRKIRTRNNAVCGHFSCSILFV